MRVCPCLWLDDHAAAESAEYRANRSIQAIVSILNDCSVVDDNGIARLRLSPPDGPGFELWHLRAAVQFLELAHSHRRLPTLVHCWSGASRSVAVVVTYLHFNREAGKGAICDFSDMDAAARQLRELRGAGHSLPQEHIWGVCREYAEMRTHGRIPGV